MSKSIIMTTSAALVLMSSVAFSSHELDEYTIQVLAKSSPQAVAEIASHGKTRGKSAGAASSNGLPPEWAVAHGLDLAVLGNEDPIIVDVPPSTAPEDDGSGEFDDSSGGR